MSAPAPLPTFDFKPVVSSNLTHVAYDAETRTLAVRFHHGGEYAYRDVSPEEHTKLVCSESVGSHYHRHFRHRDHIKLGETEDRK